MFATIWPSFSFRSLFNNIILRHTELQNNLLYKYTMMCQSNTTRLYYVYYFTRATCFDSYRIIFRPF